MTVTIDCLHYCFIIVLNETRNFDITKDRASAAVLTAHCTTVPKIAFERACNIM